MPGPKGFAVRLQSYSKLFIYSQSVCLSPVLFLIPNMFVFLHSKGDPGKTGEQGSAGVAGQRVSTDSALESDDIETSLR